MQKDHIKQLLSYLIPRTELMEKKKKISNDAYLWMKFNKYEKTYECNIKNYINKYGSWRHIVFYQ